MVTEPTDNSRIDPATYILPAGSRETTMRTADEECRVNTRAIQKGRKTTHAHDVPASKASVLNEE